MKSTENSNPAFSNYSLKNIIYLQLISDINECTVGTPCGDDVNTCTNTPAGMYTCNCTNGYLKVDAGTLWETCEGNVFINYTTVRIHMTALKTNDGVIK